MLVLNFQPFPELFTERLHLRRISDNDLDDLFILRSDPDIMKHIDKPLATSKSEMKKLLDLFNDTLSKNKGITWGISLKNEKKLIGTIGFWKILKENHRAEIGYLLHTQHQGKGIMQEAISKTLEHGFQNMKLHSVEAFVNPSNNASIKLLERNKFVREAYFRENFYYDGKFLDSAVYSLLNSDHCKTGI